MGTIQRVLISVAVVAVAGSIAGCSTEVELPERWSLDAAGAPGAEDVPSVPDEDTGVSGNPEDVGRDIWRVDTRDVVDPPDDVEPPDDTGPASTPPWPMTHGGIAQRRVGSLPGPERVEKLWSHRVLQGDDGEAYDRFSAPVVGEQNLFILKSRNGTDRQGPCSEGPDPVPPESNLVAIERGDGSVRWNAEGVGVCGGPTAVPGGGVIAMTADDGLVAWDAEGERRWRADIDVGHCYGQPLVFPDGTVYVAVRRQRADGGCPDDSGSGSCDEYVLVRVEPDGAVKELGYRSFPAAPGMLSMAPKANPGGTILAQYCGADGESTYIGRFDNTGRRRWQLETNDIDIPNREPGAAGWSPMARGTGVAFVSGPHGGPHGRGGQCQYLVKVDMKTGGSEVAGFRNDHECSPDDGRHQPFILRRQRPIIIGPDDRTLLELNPDFASREVVATATDEFNRWGNLAAGSEGNVYAVDGNQLTGFGPGGETLFRHPISRQPVFMVVGAGRLYVMSAWGGEVRYLAYGPPE